MKLLLSGTKTTEDAETNLKRLWICGGQHYSAPGVLCGFISYSNAITSISTSTSFGKRETSTVEEAVQHIRKTVTEERPFGVYAVDDHQHLIGRVPLRRLLLADPRSLILGILEEEEVVSVNAKMDREEMARVVAKYDLVTVPAWTWHQFRATADEPLGFLCMVNAARDKPHLPSEADLTELRANPEVAEFLRDGSD